MKNRLHKNHQQGFSLLESLIALFVLTIGILGVAGMQMQSMRTGDVAKQRMIAVSYSETLLERIRANQDGLDSYTGIGVAGSCSAAGATAGAVCTAATMALDDLSTWKEGLNKDFPGLPVTVVSVAGVGDATLDPDNIGRVVKVDISWNDRGVAYSHSSSSLINK